MRHKRGVKVNTYRKEEERVRVWEGRGPSDGIVGKVGGGGAGGVVDIHVGEEEVVRADGQV
jgi:hypothetical protein